MSSAEQSSGSLFSSTSTSCFAVLMGVLDKHKFTPNPAGAEASASVPNFVPSSTRLALLYCRGSRGMEIQYRCTFSDYEEVFAAQQLRPLRRKIAFALLACLIYMLGSFALVSLGLTQPRAFFAMFAAFLVLGLTSLVSRPFWLKLDFRRHPNFARPERVRIDETGLHFESEVWNGETKWLAYVKCQETQNLFLLYLGARAVQPIAKRAFSTDQVKEFRQFVREKRPSGAPTSTQRNERVEASP
jgi:hypothetical protein